MKIQSNRRSGSVGVIVAFVGQSDEDSIKREHMRDQILGTLVQVALRGIRPGVGRVFGDSMTRNNAGCETVNPPEIRYAKNGDIRIAYQVVGHGPLDLVFVPGFVSNLELHWEDPGFTHLLRRLSAFTRLILL